MTGSGAEPAVRWILLAYAASSAVAFLAYGLDKRRAVRGGRRVPERTLHLLELLGGWPGALAGAATFRHKTAKTSYRLVRAAIVGLHLLGWGWWLSRRG